MTSAFQGQGRNNTLKAIKTDTDLPTRVREAAEQAEMFLVY